MNLQQKLKLWLILLVAPSSHSAFQPSASSRSHKTVLLTPLRTTAGSLEKLDEFDISDVLAEAEAALRVAQYSLPSIGGEWTEIAPMQAKMDKSMDKDEMVFDPELLYFADERIENEEDISKLPDNMFQAAATKLAEGMKSAPNQMAHAFKEALYSEEVKEAPGRTIQALKRFLESKEVKAAQHRALMAFKEGLESAEMMAVERRRASRALKEGLGK
jgi:hypothetical protein